jgi:hypothetical protein
MRRNPASLGLTNLVLDSHHSTSILIGAVSETVSRDTLMHTSVGVPPKIALWSEINAEEVSGKLAKPPDPHLGGARFQIAWRLVLKITA